MITPVRIAEGIRPVNVLPIAAAGKQKFDSLLTDLGTRTRIARHTANKRYRSAIPFDVPYGSIKDVGVKRFPEYAKGIKINIKRPYTAVNMKTRGSMVALSSSGGNHMLMCFSPTSSVYAKARIK